MKKTSPKNGFLEAAQAAVKAKENEQLWREEDAARLARVSEEKKAAQASFVTRHLAPVVDQLLALPELKGRRFTAESRFAQFEPGEPKLSLILNYAGGTTKMNPWEAGGTQGSPYRYDKLHIVMHDYIDDQQFFMKMHRADVYDPQDNKQHMEIIVIGDPEKMKAEIGKWVAAVAPDRLPELQKMAEDAAQKQKPAAKGKGKALTR